MATRDDVHDVHDAVSARSRALAAGDRPGLEHWMHPDCTWTTHTGRVMDRAEYVGRNTTVVEWRTQRIEIERIQVVEDTAVVAGLAHDVVVEDGPEVDRSMRLTMTWVHRGHWQLLAGHAGPRRARSEGFEPPTF